jgi:hypothetical protein
MDFAFDDAKVSSVRMSELSGTEMEETEGAWGAASVAGGVVGGISAGATYATTAGPNFGWGSFGVATAGGAAAGAANPITAWPQGAGIGGAAGIASQGNGYFGGY